MHIFSGMFYIKDRRDPRRLSEPTGQGVSRNSEVRRISNKNQLFVIPRRRWVDPLIRPVVPFVVPFMMARPQIPFCMSHSASYTRKHTHRRGRMTCHDGSAQSRFSQHAYEHHRDLSKTKSFTKTACLCMQCLLVRSSVRNPCVVLRTTHAHSRFYDFSPLLNEFTKKRWMFP